MFGCIKRSTFFLFFVFVSSGNNIMILPLWRFKISFEPFSRFYFAFVLFLEYHLKLNYLLDPRVYVTIEWSLLHVLSSRFILLSFKFEIIVYFNKSALTGFKSFIVVAYHLFPVFIFAYYVTQIKLYFKEVEIKSEISPLAS